MSIGRKAIKKTLENLKQSSLLMFEQWVESKKMNIKFMSKLKIKSPKQGAIAAIQLMPIIVEQTRTATMVVNALIDYTRALEAYVSELDETFDESIKSAEEKAKKEAEKQPKIPEDLYG